MIEGLVEQLRKLGADLAELNHKALEIETELALDPRWQQLESVRESMHGIQQARDAIKAKIRPLAEAEYRASNNKHPVPGVDIRICKRLEYDEDAALAWSQEHAQKLVVLDKRAFEKVAEALGAPVTTREQAQVTFSKAL